MPFTLNGLRVIEGEIREPMRGGWTARVEVDDDEGAISGPATLVVGDETFIGMAEGDMADGRYVAQIVGGGGGLKRTLDARYYYESRLRTVVDDILREVGEALDQDEAHSELDAKHVGRWTRLRGEARVALSAVAQELGGFWRVSRAGGLVLRVEESWEDVGTAPEVDRDDAAKSATIAPDDDTPIARPGVIVNGKRVVDVVTTFDAHALRQRIAYEDRASARSPGQAVMDAAARATESARAYSQWYPARVVRQAADGSLELYADDEKIRGNGITHVPLRHGLPGCTVELLPSARVLLFFEGGDPKRPAAALFPGDAGVKTVRLHVDALLELGGDKARFPAMADETAAELEKVAAAFASFQPGSSGASFTKPYLQVGKIAASKVTVE